MNRVNLTEKAIWQNSVSYNKNHPFFTAKSSKLICQNTKNVSKESGVRCLLITVSLQETKPVFQLSICWGGFVLWVEVTGALFTEQWRAGKYIWPNQKHPGPQAFYSDLMVKCSHINLKMGKWQIYDLTTYRREKWGGLTTSNPRISVIKANSCYL